jgi:CubicO group peptidase (beta-lactamase class C family)
VELLTERRLFRPTFSSEKFPSLNYGNTYGAGDVFSTLNDLQIWSNIFQGKGVLDPSQVKKLTTVYKEEYALGLVVEKSKLTNKKMYWHDGHIGLSHTKFFHYPEEKLTVIYFSNNSNYGAADVKRFARSLNQLLSEKNYKVPIGLSWN